MQIRWKFLLVLSALSLQAQAFTPKPNAETVCQRYNAITLNMTLAQANAAVGLTPNPDQKIEQVIYSWRADQYAFNVLFVNGKFEYANYNGWGTDSKPPARFVEGQKKTFATISDVTDFLGRKPDSTMHRMIQNYRYALAPDITMILSFDGEDKLIGKSAPVYCPETHPLQSGADKSTS